MHGNVWEWCRDGYAPTFYALSPDVDPVYEGPATERILRGGSWFLDARAQRAALRGGILPTAKSQYVGFRLVREL
jgi:formylglycine-generating enzyme required for sulfatase activity